LTDLGGTEPLRINTDAHEHFQAPVADTGFSSRIASSARAFRC
jgi:hypothetical protein